MRYSRLRIVLPMVAMVAAAVAFTGCSLKKNTAINRQYTAFITRYNIYYNGDTHYKETLHDMESKYEDDYTQTLFVHPAEARQNPKAPQPTGDFTRSIEKAQKAIQIRSIKNKPAKNPKKSSDPEYKAWMKRDEYNPFLHNSWMMMGRSQFMNGDYLGAAATFFYVTKHFTWLPNTVTEAKIWQARSYVAIDWLFEAEMIITRIKPEELVNKNIRHLYNITFADFYIKSNENEKSIPYLKEAISTSSGAQKTRLWFLLGQMYESIGEKSLAYQAFRKAGSASSASYRTKFNARIKQSEVFEGDDITSEVKALKRMTRYDRNKTYLDQIYYAIGNLYLSRRDTTKAIENYELAVEKSTRSGIEKAFAQLTLGGLYYDLGKYDLAQPCYAEAIPKIPENYPDYKQLKKRSDYLDELAVYSQNVTLQDSLLKLSYMTPEEQRKVAEKLIEELKKKEKEEADQAKLDEFRASQLDRGDVFGNKNAPTSFTINSDNSWYFYNQATVTAGKTEFQRRWGSRKLEDNWRRRNKASYAFDTSAEDNKGEDEEAVDENAESPEDAEAAAAEKAAAERESDPHNVEYYLKQIPHTDEERQTSNDVIQEGLYNMGVILKDKLEDFPAAEKEFDTLLARYPDNVYRLDAYYNLYLMFVRSGDEAKAERYRQLIINDFPDSNYGQAMKDPAYIENLRKMDLRQYELYDEAYNAYLEDRNGDVHKAYEEMSRDFPMSKLMPKFMFIDALTYVTENKPDEFKEVLTEMLEKYPDTDLTPYAASYLKGLSAGKKLHSAGKNMRGMLWETRLSNDSTAFDSENPLEFDLNPDDQQLFILLYPTDKVSANQLLYDIARHNFASFVVKDFDLEQMNFGRLGLLIVKPFENVGEINHYRKVLAADSQVALPADVRPVVISAKNFDTLLRSGASFEDYFRYVEDKTYRDTEESVLPPEFYGPSEGIPDPENNPYAPENPEEQPDYEEAVAPSPVEEAEELKEPIEPKEPVKLVESVEPEEAAEIEPQEALAKPIPEPQSAEESEKAVEESEREKASEPKEPKEPAEPVEKPFAEPVVKRPQPKLPDYPVGSEGDDPLFDNL